MKIRGTVVQAVILLLFFGIALGKLIQGKDFRFVNEISAISFILSILILFETIYLYTDMKNSLINKGTHLSHIERGKYIFVLIALPWFILYRLFIGPIPTYWGDVFSISALGISFGNNLLAQIITEIKIRKYL